MRTSQENDVTRYTDDRGVRIGILALTVGSGLDFEVLDMVVLSPYDAEMAATGGGAVKFATE